MPKHRVTVARTSSRYLTITVDAADRAAARLLAESQVNDSDFTDGTEGDDVTIEAIDTELLT